MRNLRYKRIKINDKDKTEMIEEDNQEYDLVLAKFKNLFDQKSIYLTSQL